MARLVLALVSSLIVFAGAARAEVAEVVRRILSIRQLIVQDTEIAWKTLRLFESSKAGMTLLT